MNDPPLPLPAKDWQSPEFGEAIRAILDAHGSIGLTQSEKVQRFAHLGDLLRRDSQVVVGAFFALLNAALGLPQLLPAPPDRVSEIRDQLERQVYADIDEMPPPT
jgi:hypothetical protein